MEELLQTIVVLFFFLAPALKGILQSRKQRQEAGGDVDPEAEKRALEQWERMMRGEVEPEVAEPFELEPDEEPYAEPVRAEEPPPPPPRPEPEREPLAAGPLPLAGDLPSTAGASLGDDAGRFTAGFAEAEASGDVGNAPPLAVLSLRSKRRAASHTRRVDWRRAVVLSEFLSTPLALRRDAPWKGR